MMIQNQEPALGAGAVTLHLIDSVSGVRLRTWQFTAEPVIRVGRSENNHIVIHDPKVSRVHAEINMESGEWVLVNLGRNGTLLNGRSVDRTTLADGNRVRLGPEGPSLEFIDHAEEMAADTTIVMAPFVAAALEPKIDHSSKQSQVDEIAGSEYFRELRKLSQDRKSRSGGSRSQSND